MHLIQRQLFQRTVAAALLCVLGSLLAGCSSLNVPSWDPTDLLDFLDTKKPAPGDRHPVFPGGVPGMTQGVPSEYKKGTPEHQAAMAAADPSLAPPPVEPQAVDTPKAEGKTKKRVAAKPQPTNVKPQAEPSADDAGSPDSEVPPPASPPRKRAAKKPAAAPQAAATDQPQQPAAAPQQQQQSPSSFPAPLPSGTFQR